VPNGHSLSPFFFFCLNPVVDRRFTMGIADIKKTTFSNKPKQGVETVDAYDTSKISSFLTTTKLAENETLNKLFPDLKAEQISKLLSNPGTNEWLALNDMSFSDLVKAVTKSLPSGVKLSDILDGEIGLEKILEFADNLREKLTAGQWKSLDSDFFVSIYKRYEEYKKSFGKGGDWPSKIKNLAIAGINGLLDGTGWDFDELLTAAHKLGIIEKLLESGYAEDFIDWVEKSKLPQEVKDMIYKDLLDLAAKNGLKDKIKDLINKAKIKNDPWRAKNTLEIILAGYRLNPGTQVSQYASLANELIETCDELVAGWYLLSGKPHTRYFYFASIEALNVLMHDPRTKDAAVVILGFRPSLQSWKIKAKESFPFLYV